MLVFIVKQVCSKMNDPRASQSSRSDERRCDAALLGRIALCELCVYVLSF